MNTTSDKDGTLRRPVDLQEIAERPRNLDIDFDDVPEITITAHDMVRCILTGHMRAVHHLDRTNFIRCRVTALRASTVDFSSCDIKDTRIEQSAFEGCDFSHSHQNASVFSECSFVRCSFSWTNFNHSQYTDCEFHDCTFDNVLVKRCRFRHCSFRSCETNNKLFEACWLDACHFDHTVLQIDSITDNFGLRHTDLVDSAIRSASRRAGFEWISNQTIEELIDDERTPRPNRLRLAYFLGGPSKAFLEQLDGFFAVASWIDFCAVPSTFVDLIESTAEFLRGLYRNDQLHIHPLLVFHSLTYELSEHLATNETEEAQAVFRAVMGVHMLNVRLIEQFLATLLSLASSQPREITFLGSGPASKEHFDRQIGQALIERGARLLSVRPHNSPVELIVAVPDAYALLSMLALFLATRLRFELTQLQPDSQNTSKVDGVNKGKEYDHTAAPEEEEGRKALTKPRDLLKVSAGRGDTPGILLELRVRAILPGSLLAELNLDVGLAKAAQIRDAIVGFLTRSQDTRANGQ